MLLLSGFGSLKGQQFPLTNQYLFNPYALNPAFAGMMANGELFLNYRRDWTRIDNSPVTIRANGNGRVYQDKMWIGGELLSDRADIFHRFKGQISYTYRLQMTDNQFLSFGLWGSLFQNLLRVDLVNADLDDPLLKDKTRISETTYNAGFSLIYSRNRLNIGFAMPTLFRTEDAYRVESNGGFAFEQEFLFHISDVFRLDEEWQLQLFSAWRRTSHHPSSIDLSAMIIYMDKVWFSGLYRNSGLFAVGGGFEFGRSFLFNYSYEIGLSGINKQSGGSHELTVGYRFMGDKGTSFGKTDNNRKNRRPPEIRKRDQFNPNLEQYKFRR
jgi:type IX secretion system PorP/SprF family membrane protein